MPCILWAPIKRSDAPPRGATIEAQQIHAEDEKRSDAEAGATLEQIMEEERLHGYPNSEPTNEEQR